MPSLQGKTTNSLIVIVSIIALSWAKIVVASSSVRGAVVVTLAGQYKLAEYFEWSCRTIGASSELFDMLVFHEGNSKLKQMKCASNVIMIDLEKNGLSKLIVEKIMSASSDNEIKVQMTTMLSDVLIHIPRYLIEVKPMSGYLFEDWLKPYSHWTYTDPDIIWGNLTNWIEKKDMLDYDVLTIAKVFDSARLFVRGQFALHKNQEVTNNLWQNLTYFQPDSFAKRLGNAVHMLREGRSSDEIFSRNFNSAEGWYSAVVLNEGISVKILSRGFDDFSPDPVVLVGGAMFRCSSQEPFSQCMQEISDNRNQSFGVHMMDPISPIEANAYYDKNVCRMFWLPVALRYCLAKPSYDKDAALVQDKQVGLKLEKVGESFSMGGKWFVNDENVSIARRQVIKNAAFFHFRHWDDFLSKGTTTIWSHPTTGEMSPEDCMVLHLRSSDKMLTFEPCSSVLSKGKSSLRRREGAAEVKTESVMSKVRDKDSVVDSESRKILARQRKEQETGRQHH